MSKIHLLSNELINQIAAGEIIERPASVIKELIENSIDAQSSKIDIYINNAGKTKLVVEDNGSGIDKDDLLLAVQRHATSKLTSNNLTDIQSYGFRGEALPSIAAISQFTLESQCFGITVNFSNINKIIPSAILSGTKVSVENIFDNLPARLKFLRSDNIEQSYCFSIIENFAITCPRIEFTLRDNKNTLLSFKNDTLEDRIAHIIGPEIFERAIYFEDSNDIMNIYGYLFHPIDSKYSQNFQKIFINNRIVKDKTIASAIRTAYKDIIPSGRFPVCILFININSFYLDVNVSPTKSEIRFRDPIFVNRFLTKTIQNNLYKFDRVSISFNETTELKSSFPEKNIPENSIPKNDIQKNNISKNNILENNTKSSYELNDIALDIANNKYNATRTINTKYNSFKNNKYIPIGNTINNLNNINDNDTNINDVNVNEVNVNRINANDINGNDINIKDINDNNEKLDITFQFQENNESFFGEPIGQLFDTYIICKTNTDLVIIDQHAVHEKITMTKMLANININNKQKLSFPEILKLNKTQILIANEIIEKLIKYGFEISIIESALVIDAIPSIMEHSDFKKFLYDLLEDSDVIHELKAEDTIKRKIADSACHNSIRAGRKLSIPEMKLIINEMEKTISIHQCNHHRPSFIKISKNKLESIFERK